MKIRNWLSLTVMSLTLMLLGCSQIIFEHAMPTSGKSVQRFSSSFSGDYLSFKYDSSSITGSLLTVKVTEESFPEVSDYNVIFMDSMTWYSSHTFGIDTVWFEDNSLKVLSGSEEFQLSLKDTLSSKRDTSDSFFPSSVKSNDSKNFELIKHRGAYYLNTSDTPNRYVTVKIWLDDGDLLINPFYIFDEANSGDTSRSIIERYGLTKLDNKSNNWSKDYLANISDEQFRALEKEFELNNAYVRLYRLNKDSGQWFIGLLVSGLLMLVLIMEFSKKQIV